LTDSSTYGDPETEEPVNVVTKETWVRHQFDPYLGTPWDLVAYQSGVNEVTLEWEYDHYVDDRFTVYCDGCLCGATQQPFVRTYVDSGLIPGRSYVYWVKAYRARECDPSPCPPAESDPSNADTVTLSALGAFTPPPELPITNDASPLPAVRYDTDNCDLAIEYTIGHPGHFAEIELLLRNPVKVCGFNFLIKLRGIDWAYSDIANFRKVNLSQDSILIGSDWVDYPVRECFIDTTGTLISDFHSLSCRGQVGDTTEPDCNYLWVQGWADPDHCIEESGSYRALFKLGLDLSCICDADTLRSVFSDIPFGYLVDNEGQCTPFQYWPPGELFSFWSVPGDANNSGIVEAADMVFLLNYLFQGTSPPCILEAGDADSSCAINVGDIVYISNYLFMGTAAPKRGCVPCPDLKEEKQASILSK
jgi:hypothetical protein